VADANGNLYQNGVVSYDVENRVAEANGVKYAYSPDNLRIWRGSTSIDELTVYSMGQKLGAYNLSVNNGALAATCTGYYEYFGGKLLRNATGYVGQDRLGSIGKFFPYGQERTATANGTEKFATYTRDAETGLDYAQNRYHSSGDGRFLTPDPLGGSASLKNPISWNRYAYAGADPVNHGDPSGLVWTCYFVMGDPIGCEDDGNDPLFAHGFNSNCVAYYLACGGAANGCPPSARSNCNGYSTQDPSLCVGHFVWDPSQGTADGCAWNPALALWSDVSQGVHTILDLAGIVPGFGEAFDIANALIYFAEGDSHDAAISLAAMLPIGGQAVTAARSIRRLMQETTGIAGVGLHAHHVFPWALRRQFAELGIDVQGYGAWWDARDHLTKAVAYQKDWEAWLREQDGPASAEAALEQARTLARKYGFEF
jgi:RHS repeat-associated protein